MSEQTETSPDEDDERRISVRRLAAAPRITSRQIIRAVRVTLGDRPIRAISVAVVDDATLASLHERYLGDPRATDVLAFDLGNDGNDERIEGEVVVSAEAASRRAERLGLDAGEELLRYVIHGTLHLMGGRDDTRAGRRRMRQAENSILAHLNDERRAAGRPPPSQRRLPPQPRQGKRHRRGKKPVRKKRKDTCASRRTTGRV